jgi:hypothetical protein
LSVAFEGHFDPLSYVAKLFFQKLFCRNGDTKKSAPVENLVALRVPESLVVAAQVATVPTLLLAHFPAERLLLLAGRRVVGGGIAVVQVSVVIVILGSIL